MLISDAPKGHTSFRFCQPIKDNWNDWNSFVIANGFPSYTSYINHFLWNDYIKNRSLVLGNNNKNIPIYVDYLHDDHNVARSKLIHFTNGQVFDQYELISNWRLFYQNEMKKRGMKF